MQNMKQSVVAALASGAFVGLSASAHAAVIISIANVSGEPGTTALVGVYAASDSADKISGFNFPIDFNNDGKMPTLPGGFFLNATPTQNALFGFVDFNTATPVNQFINTDGITNSSSAVNATLSALPTLGR